MSEQRLWEYSAFEVEVCRRVQLSPHFLRLTFGGDSLQNFAPWGVDQRIKLVLPLADGSFSDCGLLADPTPHPSHWYARWRALPEDERNVLRTYTPSAIRPEQAEIDVDFFLHEPAGPASRWAASAQPGDALVLTGPDVRVGFTGYGIHWNPGAARRFLLIGDETAVPALRNIVGGLPPDAETDLLLQISDPADDILAPVGSVSRVVVDDSAALEQALREWGARRTEPESRYAWLAGESGVITRLRHQLVHQHGLGRKQIAFLGYWRAGGPLID